MPSRAAIVGSSRPVAANRAMITTPRRDKIPVRVVKEEEPLQHRLIRRIRRVPGHTSRVAHPSGIWPARAINIRHIPPASLALGSAPDFRPLVLTGQAPKLRQV